MAFFGSGRDFVVNGESMIMVRGGAHMSGFPISFLSELGLCDGPVTITPTFHHRDVKVTGFGPDAAADVQAVLAHVDLTFTLIHFDREVVDVMIDESLGNGIGWAGLDDRLSIGDLTAVRAGYMAPTGTLLGKRIEMYASGCNFFSLNILSENLDDPWRFRRCHLAQRPLEYPLGAGATELRMTVRAIPYAFPYLSGQPFNADSGGFLNPGDAGFAALGGVVALDGSVMRKRKEVLGSGAVIWDRELDVSGVQL